MWQPIRAVRPKVRFPRNAVLKSLSFWAILAGPELDDEMERCRQKLHDESEGLEPREFFFWVFDTQTVK